MKRLIQLVLVFFLLTSLAACGRRSHELPPLPAGATVLAFGDSLTFGTGAAPQESYPAVLASLIGRPVVNAGIPGETTADGLVRFQATLQEHRPALIILCLGGNDFLQHQGESETVANLRAMLDQARSAQIPLLLLAPPAPSLPLRVPPFYAELAREFSVPLEAEALPEILAHGRLKSDTIHPNAAGYRQLAEALAARLKSAGAV